MIRFTKAKEIPRLPKKPAGGKTAALNRLKSFLTAAEPESVKILVSAWQDQQNSITYRELREAYLSGGISEKQFLNWQKDYAKLINSTLAPKWQAAAAAGAKQVQAQYPWFLYEPSIHAGMDYIRQHGAELITNLAQEQRNAVNAVIAHVSGHTAVTPGEAARIIRPCIGLTKPQALANVRYRDAVKQAYLKAHPNGKLSTADKKAADAAARYAARQHRYRAQNIARTELAFAYNAGAYGATKDAQAQGYLGDCVKVWLTAYDERVCPVCSVLDGEKRNMDAPFSNGKLLPPAHPSCRCAVAYEEVENSNLNPSAGQVPAGIPSNEGQGAGGAGSQKPGEIIQTGTVDFSDQSAVLKQLRQAQIDFAQLEHEMNCTVTKDGKVWRVSGTGRQVNPWGIEALGSSLQGSYSYHNHPPAQTWYSFSAEDVRFFFASGAICSIASDDLYVYIMQRTKDTIDVVPDVVYHDFGQLRYAVWERANQGIIDIDFDEYHDTMRMLSEKYKFRYERWRQNDGQSRT